MMMALEGIKVIDVARYPMTIYCSMILGDLGADVIWVQEPPGVSGSSTRQTPEEEDKAAAFNALGRNKRSIVLNLKLPEAREVFYRMAGRADVVLEGYRPGVAKRLGVDYETIQRINPRIVYCSVSGYGQSGPYRDLPGHDGNYISTAGVLGIIGDKDGRPVMPSNLLADFASGGLVSAIGVLAALQARERTGLGQHIDLSMADGVAFLLASAFSQHFNQGVTPERGRGTTNGETPYYGLYETGDGQYITIAAMEPKFFQNLCHLLDRPDFISRQQDREAWPEMRALLERTFKSKSRDEWFDILSKAEVPVGKVNSLSEAAEDPQLRHREMFIEMEDRRWGKVKQVGVPFKLSRTPGAVRRLGPRRGEHTLEILGELGYQPKEIQDLRVRGAIP